MSERFSNLNVLFSQEGKQHIREHLGCKTGNSHYFTRHDKKPLQKCYHFDRRKFFMWNMAAIFLHDQNSLGGKKSNTQTHTHTHTYIYIYIYI